MAESHDHQEHDHDHECGEHCEHDHGPKLEPRVEVEDLGNWKRKLKVEVAAEKVKAEYEEVLNELAKSAQVPGFRRGHVPRARILKQYGKELTEDVRLRVVARASEEALKAEELVAVSQPDLDLEAIALDPSADLAFEFEIEVQPQFDMPDYKNLAIESKVEEVTDDAVGRFIDSVRRSQAEMKPVEDGAEIVSGDRLTVDYTLTAEGAEPVKAENETCHLVEDALLGLPGKIPASDVAGLKVGGEKTVKVTVVDGYRDEALRGKEAELALRVVKAERAELPELDDTEARKLGAADVASLREQARGRLQMQAESRAREDMERQVSEQLLSKVDFDLPAGMLQRETRSREIRQITRLAQMGIPVNSLEGEHLDQIRGAAAESGEKGLKLHMILGKIAEAEKIELTENELEAEIYRYAAATRRTPVAVRSELEREGRLDALHDELLAAKVMNFVISTADTNHAVGEEK